MKYVFLSDNEKEDELAFLAIAEDLIQPLKVSETYDREGNQVGTEEADDSILLKSQKAVDIANELVHAGVIEKIFTIGDEVSGYHHSIIHDKLLDELSKAAVEGEDYIVNANMCQGFHYSKGEVNQTVIVSYNHGLEADFTVLEFENVEQQLNEAINTRTFEKALNGEKHYHHADFIIKSENPNYKWAEFELIPRREDAVKW